MNPEIACSIKKICIEPIQAKYNELMQHPDYLTEVYRKGAARATEIASETIRDIHARIGYVER